MNRYNKLRFKLILAVFVSFFLIYHIWRNVRKFYIIYGYESLLQNDQHDPELIAFIKEEVIQPPSGLKYNLLDTNSFDYSQYKEGPFLLEYFKTKKNGTFIEAGALNGETFSNTLGLERKFGWSGLLIEPNPLEYHLLTHKHRKAYHANCCLSLTSRASEVFLRLYGSSTAIITDPDRIKKSVLTVKVKCYPLYSLMAASKLTTVDFFSLDVESMEMKILETIPWNDVTIKTILVENNLIPEGKDFLRRFLENKDYIMLKALHNSFFFVKKS